MLDNKQRVSIKFNSVSGIIMKTHPKSTISYCDMGSSFYERIPSQLILQIMLVSEKRVVVEYLTNPEHLNEIYYEDNEPCESRRYL